MMTCFPTIKTVKTTVIVKITAQFEIVTSEDRDNAKEAVERALESLQTYGAALEEYEVKEAR